MTVHLREILTIAEVEGMLSVSAFSPTSSRSSCTSVSASSSDDSEDDSEESDSGTNSGVLIFLGIGALPFERGVAAALELSSVLSAGQSPSFS